MDAKVFNYLYGELVFKRLKKYGFVKRGNSLYYQSNGKQLAIIRKSYGRLKLTNIIICLRHCILNSCSNDKKEFYTDPNEYPFKILPCELKMNSLKNWHYTYREFGKDGFIGERINYGEDEKVWGKYGDIELKLDQLYFKIEILAMEWFSKLSRECALNQLLLFNTGSDVEIKWIDKYKVTRNNNVINFPIGGNKSFNQNNLKKSNW